MTMTTTNQRFAVAGSGSAALSTTREPFAARRLATFLERGGPDAREKSPDLEANSGRI